MTDAGRKIKLATLLDRVEMLHVTTGDKAAEMLAGVALTTEHPDPTELLKQVKTLIRRTPES
jgi:hypothetical protein